jgi:uroporphyrinogen-III synthase
VGVEAIHHPLITIQSGSGLSELIPQLLHADIIIAVSQHAVHQSNTLIQDSNLDWPKSAQYLAVGQKTAHVLSKASKQQVNYPDISDSEHFLQLAQLQYVQGKRVIILRGNGGRELIYDTLTHAGAIVEYIEAYKRENIAFRADLHIPFWQDKHISQLVVTSSGQLRHFVSQLNQKQKNWIYTRSLYVPSERIAQEAKDIGFQDVTNTSSASNQDLLAALRPNDTGQ